MTNPLETAACIVNAGCGFISLTMAYAFATRFRLQGSRAWLLLLVFASLTGFYGLAAVDAFVHISASTPRLTHWTLAASLVQFLTVCLAWHFCAATLGELLRKAKPADNASGPVLVAILGYFNLAAMVVVHAWPSGWDPKSLLEFDGGLLFAILFVSLIGQVKGLAEGREESGFAASQRLTVLDLEGTADRDRPSLLPPGTDLNLTAFGLAGGTFLCHRLSTMALSGPAAEWKTVVVLLLYATMLPCLAGLVHAQTRATFFDVLLKRGTAVALAMVVALCIAVPFGAAIAVFAMGAALLWHAVQPSLRRWLDRAIFGRSGYTAELTALQDSLAKAGLVKEAEEITIRTLTRALRAGWVSIGEGTEEAEASASAGAIRCGERRRGQPYQSEDLLFLDSAATALAVAVDGLKFREQRSLAAEAEVRALRAQINPHFLFNSLNSMADMVRDIPRAEEAVLNLARVFRHALDATQRRQSAFGAELDFLTAYLDLEKLRLGDGLRYTIMAGEEVRALPVAPMAVEPLLTHVEEGGDLRIEAEMASQGGVLLRMSGKEWLLEPV